VWFDRGKDDLDPENPSKKVVYRYIPGLGTLEAVGTTEWKTATGEIMDCELSWSEEITPFVWDDRSMALRFKGALAQIAGQTALHVILSPDKEHVAVLSAEGPWKRSFIPHITGGAGGSASGARHHEVLRRKDGIRQGAVIRLDHKPSAVPFGGCWSPDGRFVIYVNDGNSLVWIVPVSIEPSKDKP